MHTSCVQLRARPDVRTEVPVPVHNNATAQKSGKDSAVNEVTYYNLQTFINSHNV